MVNFATEQHLYTQLKLPTYQKSLKYLLYILKYLCGNHVTSLMAIIHAYFCCTCKNGNSNNTEKLIRAKKGLFGQ